jgi:gliding motility-associated-like protein
MDAGSEWVSYRWQDNKADRFYQVFDEGLYWVEVADDEGCFSRDSIFIEKSADVFPSMVYMPTAFTPNGNSVNDFYPDNKFHDLGLFYEVKLFNRWGQKIADFNSPSLNWDGNLNGVPAPEGVYAYLVTWIGCDNKRRTLTGNFQLMR